MEIHVERHVEYDMILKLAAASSEDDNRQTHQRQQMRTWNKRPTKKKSKNGEVRKRNKKMRLASN